MEFDYPEIYAPLDLKVGRCRLVVAAPAELVRARRSHALEPCAHRHQISRDHAPPLRRARRAGRMHQAQRRDGAGAAARPLPAHRRSRADRRHPEGERAGRDRAHRRHHLAPHRQPRRAQDAAAARSAAGSSASARPPMPLRLDTGAPGFEAAFARAPRRQARDRAPMSMPRSPAILADVRARGDAAVIELHAALRPPRPDRRDAADPRRRDRGRGRPLLPRDAGRRSTSRHDASRPITAASCRRISTTSTRPASGSARAGGRSPRSGSTCRAALRPIPPRC